MRDTAGVTGEGPGAEQRPFVYGRRWGRWPCELREENGEVAIAACSVPVTDIPARVEFYDPFNVYLDEEGTNRPPHLALATCGALSADEEDQIAGFDEFDAEDHQGFFTGHGCTAEDALGFTTRWGMLEYGLRFPLGPWAANALMPLWEFRGHASLTWAIVRVMRVLRSARQDEHVCRHWYGMLQWLAGIPGPLTLSGPAVSAFRGMPDWTRLMDAQEGDWRQQPTAAQRLAVLLESVINIFLQDALPLCRFVADHGGRAVPEARYATQTLLQAIRVMLYLDLTGGKDARTCGYRRCPEIFRLNEHQKAAERRGCSVYCQPEHGTREAQLRYREENASRARRLERARQRRHRRA
jgi:hypothetical protein